MELLWATIVTPALVSTSPPLLRSPFAAPRAILTLEDSGGGALAAAGSQLEQVLGSLPPNEKYNAVLTSLLSAGSSKSGAALELVEEMTSKGLPMSSDALKSLVDAAVDEGTPESLLGSLRVAKGNGVCRAFATPQLRLPGKPSSSELNSLSPTPTDGRASEVAAATAFSAATALLLLAELLDLFDFLIPGEISAPPPGFVLFALAAGWAFDRYARAGETFGLIGRGLTRLFSRDLQRECAVESASFLLGYLLGLPCCPFAPTVFKPLDMLTTSGGEMERDIGAPARLVDRVLIWLLAPAAVETLVYREMLQSEPTLGPNFLEAARRREASLGVDVQDGEWSPTEDDGRVRWAYAEARRLLQRYSGVREALQERMQTGVSAGECVALIEERLKNSWGAI